MTTGFRASELLAEFKPSILRRAVFTLLFGFFGCGSVVSTFSTYREFPPAELMLNIQAYFAPAREANIALLFFVFSIVSITVLTTTLKIFSEYLLFESLLIRRKILFRNITNIAIYPARLPIGSNNVWIRHSSGRLLISDIQFSISQVKEIHKLVSAQIRELNATHNTKEK